MGAVTMQTGFFKWVGVLSCLLMLTLSGSLCAQPPVVTAKPLRLADPGLGATSAQPPAAPAAQKWNVVWIILESTGTRYVQGEASGGKTPMPFLQQLASQGWRLANHHAAANSSARAIFSQLSGLYPMPTVPMWVDRPDVAVPALPGMLGAGWDKFLFTPGRLSFYFPSAFLRRAGLALSGYLELALGPKGTIDALARREEPVVDAFLARLHAAQEPFLGVYYSYVAHWPYSDHGPQYRKHPTSNPVGRYLNNLVTLDAQIQRIFQQVQADGRLDRTIFVLAGDHGEAFGQHKGNWSHPKFSFEENLQAPAVLWQPKLFAPRVVTELTSHVDLLPTVLDALGIRYQWELLQGESLLRGPLARKAVFAYGKEGTATLIAADGTKVHRGRSGDCWAYDLASDPRENRRLPCTRYPAWTKILDAEVAHQRGQLAAYNVACAAGQPHAGLIQPGVAELAKLRGAVPLERTTASPRPSGAKGPHGVLAPDR